MARYDTISFLTDYGTTDESVGIIKSVIRSIAPHAQVLDISHNVPAFDVRAAGLMLARSADYLVPGVLLAVVDPGAGTNRKAIAIEIGNGESILVGPDNGLLAPLVAVTGGAQRAVELTNPNYQIEQSGYNFDGRDIFGPVAAHLCNGVELSEFGPIIDPSLLIPATLPFSEEKNGALHCDVIYVDHFGNLHLNVAPEQIQEYGASILIEIESQKQLVQKVQAYGDVNVGQALLMSDGAGMLVLAINQASAADHFSAHLGSTVLIQRSL